MKIKVICEPKLNVPVGMVISYLASNFSIPVVFSHSYSNIIVAFDATELKFEEVQESIKKLLQFKYGKNSHLDVFFEIVETTSQELKHEMQVNFTPKTTKRKKKEEIMEESKGFLENIYISQIEKVRENLEKMIPEQSYIIRLVCEKLFNYFANYTNCVKNGPLMFLVVEPFNNNVSKALAEVLSEAYGRKMLELDGNDYLGHEASIDMFGINGSYRDARQGTLTSFVKSNPRSVIRFANFEKSDPEIKSAFTKINRSGMAQDRNAHLDVSLKDCFIVYSTGLGEELYDNIDRFDQSSTTDYNVIKKSITQIENDPHDDNKALSVGFLDGIYQSGAVILPDRQTFYGARMRIINEIEASIASLNEKNLKVDVDLPMIAMLQIFKNGGELNGNAHQLGSFMFPLIYDVFNRAKDFSIIKSFKFNVDYSNLTDDVKEILLPEASKALFFCNEELWKYINEQPLQDVITYHAITFEQAEELIKNNHFDVILLDYTLGAEEKVRNLASLACDGAKLYDFLQKRHPEIPVYLIRNEGYGSNAYEQFYSARGLWNGHLQILSFILFDIIGERGCKKLSRSKKALNFSYELLGFDKSGCVHYKICNFKLDRYIHKSDKQYVVDEAEIPNVRFSDVIGCEEFKEAFTRDILPAFQDPAKYTQNGRKLPRAILQYGPPGVGKTLCAKAAAGEAGVVFIPVDTTTLLDAKQGEGCKKLREIFRIARSYGSAIIFFDEIDTLGHQRNGENLAHEALTNTFLAEMDGFKQYPNSHVVVIGATNFFVSGENALDPAFVRRFDYRIKLTLPNIDERKEFIEYYLKKGENTVTEHTIDSIAKRSGGCSPADLETVIEHAFRMSDNVNDEMLEKAFVEYQFGKELEISDEDRLATTYHEVGHALVAYYLGREPEYLTNISRGSVDGYMMTADDGRRNITKKDLIEMVTIALAGRVAELIVYGQEQTTIGASQDLKRATTFVKKMLTEYAMQEGCLVSYDDGMFGSAVELKLFNDINTILLERFEYAKKILVEHKAQMECLKDALLDKGALTGEEIKEILREKSGKKNEKA